MTEVEAVQAWLKWWCWGQLIKSFEFQAGDFRLDKIDLGSGW